MPQIESDRNLLFGVIAMQSGLIEKQQFADACALWASRGDCSLADILVEQGSLLPEDREHVRYLLKRRLQKASVSAESVPAEMPRDVKATLNSFGDKDVGKSDVEAVDGDRFTTSEEISPTTQRDDRIMRRELHSTGGVGTIWKAHDRLLNREIALKELKVDQADADINRQRFFREAQITAQLTHPGIVPVHDYVEAGGRSYYMMQFVQGRTLADVIQEYHNWIRTEKKSGVTKRLLSLINQFLSVCNTIAFAHSRRVIHRDLKTENVIVGDFGEVVVLDWGLAKRLDESEPAPKPATVADPKTTLRIVAPVVGSSLQTMQGQKLGTPAYMSPEQARGEIELIDERSDVYGLAAILYEILVGQPPFSGDTVAEVLEHVIHDPPRPPGECVAGIPPDIERICLRGLAKKRDDRQTSAAELADELQSWFADRAEQTFQELLESAPDAMLVTDDSGTIVRVNTRMESLSGYPRAELVGKPIEVLVPKVHRAGHARSVAAFFAEPKVRPMAAGLALFAEHKDGNVFPVDISLSPVRTELGMLVSCAVRPKAEIPVPGRVSS